MHPRKEPKTVLSLVGAGRSGSTILGNALAEVPGFFGAGELRWLWARDLPQQRLCGCGRPPRECPVWSAAVAHALGVAPEDQDGPSLAPLLSPVAQAQQRMSAVGNRRRLLTGPGRTGEPDAAVGAVTAATTGMIDALFEVTGATTLVDGSKRPQEAAVLAASGAYDHYVVHIVRDPRAVVWSWQRVKPLPASTGRTAMGTRSQRRTLMRWVENAVGAEVLRRHVPADRWLFVRYEDFAARPRGTVEDILRFLGSDAPAPFTSEDTVQLGPNHNLSGNPNRFTTGPVRITPDAEWAQRLPRRRRATVEAATLPFLLRYGYPLTTPAAEAGTVPA